MSYVFTVLKWMDEKAKLAALSKYYRKHDNSFKEAFFLLEIMDAELDMANFYQVFLKLKVWNPHASFFADYESDDKISKICVVIGISERAHQWTFRAFEGILDAVQVCAQMNTDGTDIVNTEVLGCIII